MTTTVPIEEFRAMKRSTSHGSNVGIDLANEGEIDTLDFRMQAVDQEGSKKISLWHDVSLVHLDPLMKQETPYMNFVCEIPKFSRYVPL